MFCPKCKSEYREGFYKCADCGIDLVDQLPQDASEDIEDHGYVEIFSTYHQDDISFLKSILDGEGISYFFHGENSIILVAAGAYARLMVEADDVPRAKEILQDLGFLEQD
jgi:hypothetical protein